MADKETGFNITVGAEADVNSVKKAVDDIGKAVDSSVKGGRIEVPVDITIPIDKSKDKLTKAQKDITAEISKMMSKGFSASGKDIDTLISKFNEFTKAFDQAGKGRQNKVFKEIRRQVEDLQKSYRNLQKTTRTGDTKINRNSQKKPKSKRYNLPSDEEINANIESEQRRRLKGLKQAGPRGFKRNVGFDGGVATERTAKESENSSYRSSWARQLRISALAAIKWMRDSLKVQQNKELANEYASNAINGNKKRPLSEQEIMDEKAEVTSNELAKILGGIEHERPDVSLDLFNKYLEGVLRFGASKKDNELDGILLALNKTFNRWFNVSGNIGGTDGDPKGEFAGHLKALEAVAGMIERFKEVLELDEKISKEFHTVSIEQRRQWKELAKIDPDAAEKAITAFMKGEIAAISNTAKQPKSTVENNSILSKELDKISAEARYQTSAIETQTTYDKLDNVKKDTDMAKELKIETTNSNINKDTAGAVKKDVTTGFNTDANADKVTTLLTKIFNALPDTWKSQKPPEKQYNYSSIGLPGNGNDLYKKLEDATRLALPAPDGRRRKISKGLTPEPSKSTNEFALVQQSMTKALAVIPGEFAKTLKEAIHPSVRDEQAKINRPDGKGEFIYDETLLRQLADASNARKEARRNQDDTTPSEKVIIPDYQSQVEKSKVYASPFRQGFWGSVEDVFHKLVGTTQHFDEVLNASAEDQEAMAAERVKTYGLNNGRNPNDTGDIAGMRRILELYRTNKSGIESNAELKQKINLTGGRTVDTTELTKQWNKVLSGRNMRNAQMGGGPIKQIFGALRGFTFMPSLEKSRARADGLNQILGNVNNALNSVLANIQTKETELAGMEKTGQIKFDGEGNVIEGTSAAKKTLADLEEEKLVLDTIRADLLANDEIISKTGANYGRLIKQLRFTSPVLKDNNTILRNINAGYDKGGKALKFQTRWGEILNYTFQLISRSVGQWLKKMLSLLNPLNIIKNTIRTISGWIKSAFSDFGSYDVKWQRTMNVVKINFQRAIKPAMEWIAQKLVNIIGFFDIIIQKIQAAFGQMPVSLFDQAGADAEKIRRELEEAADVTAGFDELHDIGSNNSGANDLMGDIYTPQLSQEWIDKANEIGDLLAGLIKGEKTIGEVLGRIFEMVLDLLGKIAKAIWDWFKTTSIGKYLTENWKKILGTILKIFLAWELLKIAGPALLNALFGKLMEKGVISGIFSKIGGWISGLLGASGFGSGILLAFQSLFAGGKYSLIGTLGEMFTNASAITAAGSWGSMIGFALVKGLVGVVSIALGGKMLGEAIDSGMEKGAYNIGLEEAGGKDSDKKSIGFGDMAKGTLSGAAIGFGVGQIIPVIGPVIGAAAGAIVGALTTALSPAFEQLEADARAANNEMQRLGYYEGIVQGASTQVQQLDEMMRTLNDTLTKQTEKVYDQGEKLGISKDRMDLLVKSTQDGTFNTSMLTSAEMELAGSLEQLTWQQEHNAEVSEKLEKAKRKLQKAELDLAIAQDIEAGNFEMAAARVEYALAAELYTSDEATKKMTQIIKKGSAEQQEAILKDLSPDMQKNFNSYYDVTKGNIDELTKLYFGLKENEREAWLQNLTPELEQQMRDRVDAIKRQVENAPWYMRLLDVGNDGKIFGHSYIDVPGYATGTNYVPNDGLAYLHKGEAVIPAKYNEGVGTQGKAYEMNAATSQELMKAINQLNNVINQGINVKGQFVQRGSDLVATVEKANNRLSNTILNNKVYAR